MSGIEDDVLAEALAWRESGQKVALATVVATWGSAPRAVGSLMAIAEDGRFAGSVSGGCVEAAVVADARAVMADGRPRQLSFGVTHERAWEVGLACGGRVEIFLEPIE